MSSKSLFDEGFESAVIATFERARQETLDAGVPIFYRDSASGTDIMERPDGRKFEIRYVRNAPTHMKGQSLFLRQRCGS